jgi:hypothetical protein
MAKGRKIKVEGMSELMTQLNKIGKDFPQRVLNDITHDAIKPTLTEARQRAPLGYTHQLEEGIIEIKEKDKKGKSVRQVVMDKTKNSIFQKQIPDPEAKNPQGVGTRGGKRDTAYYPTSIEYGFHVSKDKKVPGQFFLHGTFKKNRAKSRKIIKNGLSKAIDKLTR